jgi:hypothetical protein
MPRPPNPKYQIEQLFSWNSLILLFTTFGVLREASYESGDKKLSEVLTTLEDVTRDAIGGFNFLTAKVSWLLLKNK